MAQRAPLLLSAAVAAAASVIGSSPASSSSSSSSSPSSSSSAAAAGSGGAPSASCSLLAVNTTAPVNVLPPHFATWNIDSSRDRLFFDADLASPALRYLAGAMTANHSHIRFGGTGNDALYYGVGGAPDCGPTRPFVYECYNQSLFDNMVALAGAAGAQIIFGLNIHPATGAPSPPKGPWDPSNARFLLAELKRVNAPLGYLELGASRPATSVWRTPPAVPLHRR